MAWELEQAADRLRRADPPAWAELNKALALALDERVERLVRAPLDEMQILQGEARALGWLVGKLVNANQTVEQLKRGGTPEGVN